MGPLVNVYITDGKITMLLMGKSTISIAIFNSKLLVITRGYMALPWYTMVYPFTSNSHGFSSEAFLSHGGTP